MRRKFPEGKRCCGVFLLVAAFFWFAADFLECGGNFRRNALRQKFPPQEVLGIHGRNSGKVQHEVVVTLLPCGFPTSKLNGSLH